MELPLYNSLRAFAGDGRARFHMPGHKGRPVFDDFAAVFALDFTETWGTGNLYTDEGPIRDAERLAARYYGAADCCFLTGGSTQGVLSMLAAAAEPGGAVLLDRGCHQSAAYACTLLDLRPRFVYPRTCEPLGAPGALEPADVAAALNADPAICAVLVVSPTYHGVVRDLPALAAVCHARGARLLVDCAHGAHFPAVGLPSPIACGADLATLSAHKTLPALGQGAYLLSADPALHGALREKTKLFGTSSPSYPIMATLDLARGWLEENGGDYGRTADAVRALRQALAAQTPFAPLTGASGLRLDPCRLTVCTAGTDRTGGWLAETLFREYGVACEMSDDRSAVFIVTPADLDGGLERLRAALFAAARDVHPAPLPEALPPLPTARAVRPVRQAMLGPCREAPLETAAGAVCARPVTPYPPGIPVLWPGEEIRPKHVELLQERCYNKVHSITICDDRP